MKLAILDDYQNAALAAADWTTLGGDIEIIVFDTHLGTDEDAIALALADFEVLVAMRERTPFPASLLAKLPRLKLLVTTGMRNLAIDMDAAHAQGVTVAGTAMLPLPGGRARYGADPRSHQEDFEGKPADAFRRMAGLRV